MDASGRDGRFKTDTRKKDAVESVSNINFDYRRTEWLRNSVLAEVLLKIQR
jgi:hypothetical protein